MKPSNRNWGNIQRELKKEIDARNSRTANKMWSKPSNKEFFEGVYASLDAVRVAWRNSTMHVENKYTEEEAEHIHSAVRGFMKNLATCLDENGQPFA